MLHNWLYSPEAAKDTPSRRAGMSSKDEERVRREGTKIITDVGKQLKLRANPTLYTAGIFFHRFYQMHSFQEFPRELTALGCLFLAGKVEETPKKCRDVVMIARTTFKSLYTPHRSLLDEVMGIERVLLKTLNFDLAVDHPYRFLLTYVTKNTKFKFSEEERKKLVQTAWTFINDSIGTNLCLQWEAQILAIAFINLALKFNQRDHDSEWWEEFVANLSLNMVEDICHKLLDYYTAVKHEKYDFVEAAKAEEAQSSSQNMVAM